MADTIAAPAAPSTPVPASVDTGINTDTSVDSGVESQVDAGTVAAASKKVDAPKSSKKKFQVKVDGNVEDIELDLSNEEELRKHLQFSKVANKRMQEAADLKKGVNELVEMLRTDPLKVIADPRLAIPDEIRQKMAQAIINKEIEEMGKTPEQKEKERLQAEYERLKQQVEEEKTARQQAEFARLQEQQAVSLDKSMSEAIESSGLPKNARTVRYMAEAMLFALQNNIDLSPQDIVPYVKKQALSEFKEMISALPDDDFENWLGKDQLSRIRRRNVQKAKLPETAASIKSTGAEVNKSEKSPEKENIKDFLRRLGR